MRQDTVKDILQCLADHIKVTVDTQCDPIRACGGCTNDGLCYTIRRTIRKYPASAMSQETIAANG